MSFGRTASLGPHAQAHRDEIAAHWPNSHEPAAAVLTNATKYVASTALKSVEWQNSQLLEGPLTDAVNTIKAQDGPEIQAQGSANLSRCTPTG